MFSHIGESTMIRLAIRLFLLSVLVAGRAQFAIASDTANATTRPVDLRTAESAVVVQGTIRAQGQPLPAETIVFLEPKDATRHFPVPATRARISQKGAQFSPALTVVSVGQSVEFVNDEDRSVEHNVFSNASGSAFDLGLFPPGQSRSVAFDTAGPIVLYCSVHKFMDGVVYVCPTSLFSRVDNDGHYRIEGVPPGNTR